MTDSRRVVLTAALVACLLVVLLASAPAAVAADTPAGGDDTPATFTAVDRADTLAAVTARCDLSPTSIAPGESVTLDASTSQDADIYRYDPFGTGEFGDLADRATRTVTYQEAGTYEPQVKAINATTETTDQVVCGTLTVASTSENRPPTAEVSYSPTEPVAGEPVAFSVEATDPNDDLLEYDWRVNGRQISVYPEFEYTFDGPGEYEVAVTVSDDDGAADTVRRVVTVASTSDNRLPAADFSVTPQEPTPGAETTFVADASDPDGEVVEYTWQVDGERVAGGSQFTVSLPEVGEYEVRLTATDDDGGVATATTTVTVSGPSTNQPPTAAFDVDPPAPVPGQTVAFEATASDSDGNVGGYQWRVDGSVVAEGPEFEYAFRDRGEYTVTLAVTDDDGATASASRAVTVEGEDRTQTATPQPTTTATPATPQPTGNLTLTATWWHSPTVPLRGEPVTLVASGPTNPAVTYQWDVDDDGTYEARGALASHVFTTAGDHAVTLEARLPDGSTKTTTEAVAVTDGTVARPGTGATVLWHAPVNPQPGETVALVADIQASDEVTAYRWDVDDDGRTDADGEVAAHTYPTEGRYTAHLTVEYDNGSTTTAADTVVVGDPPAATATPSPASPRTTTDGGTGTDTSVPGTTGGGSPGFGLLAGLVAFAVLAARLVGETAR